jgi:putative acetyltransferase
LTLTIARESPVGADLAQLFARHTVDMHADTPPESIHMMDARQLNEAGAQFFVLRDAGAPIGMGAFKPFEGTHAEIKSMHVLVEYRGKGLSRLMLHHIMDTAKAVGMTRLSLETGSQDMFLPARLLYERAGFTICPPFGTYVLDPMSVFMTLTLA